MCSQHISSLTYIFGNLLKKSHQSNESCRALPLPKQKVVKIRAFLCRCWDTKARRGPPALRQHTHSVGCDVEPCQPRLRAVPHATTVCEHRRRRICYRTCATANCASDAPAEVCLWTPHQRVLPCRPPAWHAAGPPQNAVAGSWPRQVKPHFKSNMVKASHKTPFSIRVQRQGYVCAQ
jgi:hypothetical protein